ncbi:MAG: methyltransferase domain-containing protein [Lentisphaerae bacterium]|nr:methyltransferase domain-containing protein [Lentisphaerota bacterium]MCP4100070.1 methyltransferase domain-containing protein [Lentisphaerota bacterium]
MRKDTVQTAGMVFQTALYCLEYWERQRMGLDDIIDELADPKLRPVVSSLLFEYFRNRAFIERLLRSKFKRMPKPRLRRALAVITTQCLFQSGIGRESAVNVGVSAVKTKYGVASAGFVNAVMRSILSENNVQELEKYKENPFLTMSEELLARWKKQFSSEELNQIISAMRIQPELTFRLTGKVSEAELEEIGAVKLENLSWNTDFTFYRTSKPRDLFAKSWLAEGRIYIQDPATSMALSLPEVKAGSKVLDMCAAPGGKALMLSEHLKGGGHLVAADRSSRRQELTAQNFKVRNLDCEIVCAAADKLDFKPESFDLILADVPCSNTGVYRHRPDAMWRFSKAGLNDIVDLQRRIIEKAFDMLAPGGQLIYSTCSIDEEEDEKQVEWILSSFDELKFVEKKKILPSEHWDGAFAALFIKAK